MGLKMEVEYSYLKKQFENPEKILASIRELARNGDFTLGEQVENFEKKFKEITKAEHVVGVSSGSAALYLSLRYAGIKKGDEVITVPNTFFSTVNEIVAVGGTPRFVDVGEDYLMDFNLIEDAITEKTKAIMPVHLTGRPADMGKITEIAKKHNLAIVEDAAQAICAEFNKIHVGTFGIGAGFSLHPLKNLNVWGDAGVLTTNSGKAYKKLIQLRNNGLEGRNTWALYGHNLRMASIQALVANHVVQDVDTITNTRIKNAKLYDSKLSKIKRIKVPPRNNKIKEVFHTYVIQVENREGLMDHLLKAGIDTKIHYPIPLHLQPAAKNLGYKKGDFPVAEEQAEKILSLPIHQYLTEEQINYVAEKIKEFYN